MYIKASEGLNKVLSARQQRRRLSLITGVKQSVMQSMDIVSRKLSPVFLVLLVVGFALFVRIAVSLNSFSGAGKPPLYGDYEAQRHWMEITYHLPVSEWYVNGSRNDLLYWGLDYPPLTAYHSWLCGAVAHRLDPSWVALGDSRGHESPQHKQFMRYSVLLADVAVYFSAVLISVMVLCRRFSAHQKAVVALSLLLQPSLLLIDHGHFQYNCVSLGLALWGIALVSSGHDVLGSIDFVLALNYKQMELYHSFPFFFYLLGKALRSKHRVRKVVALGITVIATFGLCWAPFLSSWELTLQLLHRLFPFERGLFEDKVANIWCSMSIVLKLRSLFSLQFLVRLASLVTLLASVPSSLNLFQRPTCDRFILALANTSLAFFLFSFQVHEKSILLAALPIALLAPSFPRAAMWFAVVASYSMYPLLVRDGLGLTSWALCGLYLLFSATFLPSLSPSHLSPLLSPSRCVSWLFGSRNGGWIVPALKVLVFSLLPLLCALSHVVPPPVRYPDLFPVLISSVSCLHFLGFFAYFNYAQLTCCTTSSPSPNTHAGANATPTSTGTLAATQDHYRQNRSSPSDGHTSTCKQRHNNKQHAS